MAELISALLIAGLLAITSFLVVDKSLQLGEMMAILTVVGSILPAVAGLAMTNIQIQEANVAFDRMYEYTHLQPEYQKLVHADQESRSAFRFESLTIDALHFRFPGRPLLLENIALTIRKGELVALLGESGHGKSTLLQLIQRFYALESGQISVNGVDWNTLDTATWRQTIGVVPQHTKLCNGTLLDNIGLSNTATEADKIVRFCQQSGFAHYFEDFPQGYLTLLGENGINLSGGQRQLVALARALYQKPQLILLDEPTAAMDKHTEQFVMNLLDQLRPHLTILLITHKFSLTKTANRVYSITNGVLQGLNSPVCSKENEPQPELILM
ncbi:ATP-binding cassette domain-containing protein [Spirosoma fluviale]|uniref:ATP-binding cassette domain-containing protein n=1 Tax=Spirosoma fluviale TaxID=1597977 RepID=UPI000BE3E7C4|nr:ABC transporter ATP-binding protein [Spirosoma fluviale]